MPTKHISVVGSLGESAQPVPLPAQLRQFCSALEIVTPDRGFKDINWESNLSQIHLISIAKAMKVYEGVYGVQMDWTPLEHKLGHTVQPGGNVWDPNSSGLIYPGTTRTGQQWFVGVQFDA